MFDFIEITNVDIETPKADKTNQLRCFFDLEGTLRAKDGDILQIAAIITDWDFNIIEVYSEYYQNHTPIRIQEFKIHGITEDIIKEQATRHFVESIEQTPFNNHYDSFMYISYTTFDIERVNEELLQYGVDPIDFGEEVPTMAADLSDGRRCHYNAFRLGQKKGELVARELGQKVFDDIYKELADFGDFEMKGSHDALYDSVMMLALCRRHYLWENS